MVKRFCKNLLETICRVIFNFEKTTSYLFRRRRLGSSLATMKSVAALFYSALSHKINSYLLS